MKTVIALFVLISLAAPLRAAGEDAKVVASKITDVTVYADRARVTRTAVGVPLGGRVVFSKLPGWTDEGSVRVSLAPADAGELTDVQVEKTFLARPEDEEIRKAEAAVTEISDQLASLDDERAALDSQARQLDAIRAFSLDKMPKDAAVREVKVEEYAGLVKFIGASTLDISKAKRELDKKRRDLQPEMNARQKKLNDLRQRAQLEQRSVVVATTAKPGATATMTLTYMLPGTTWEPVHELRAAPDGKSASVASYAVVSQTTGEDWDGAILIFSTQRPNATERVPELAALLVGGAPSLARALSAGEDTFNKAEANYLKQNTTWNAAVNREPYQQSYAENVKGQHDWQEKVAQTFEKVQQRGTTAQFTARGPQTVRTDGRTVRVQIGLAQLAATPRIVAVPELSLNAVHAADLVNAANQPLLPGKVLLFAEGAFVGTTETEFVAPGDSFTMFLGVANRVKLSRTLDMKRSSLNWSGKRKRMLVSFVVSVENLSEKPVSLQLADRIPVSETEDIYVKSISLKPDAKPDVKGLLKWEIALSPKEKREFRIEYTLDYPADLLQRAAANPPDGAQPRASDQIRSLEKAF